MLKIYLTKEEQTNKDKLMITIRKFRKTCDKAGVFRDLRKHEAYEKPSEKERRKESRRRVNMLRAIKERESTPTLE